MLNVPQFQANAPDAVHAQQVATPRGNNLGFFGGAAQGLQLFNAGMKALGKDPASLAAKAQIEQSKQAAWDNFINRGGQIGLEGRKAYAEAGKILHPEWSEAIDAIDWDNLKDEDIAQSGTNATDRKLANFLKSGGQPVTGAQPGQPAPEDANHPWVTGQPVEEPQMAGPEIPLGATGNTTIPPGPTEQMSEPQPTDPMAGGPSIPFGGDQQMGAPIGPEQERQVAEALPDAAEFMTKKLGLPPGSMYQTKDGSLYQDVASYKEGDIPGRFIAIPPKSPGDEVTQLAVAEVAPLVKEQFLPSVQELAVYRTLQNRVNKQPMSNDDMFIMRMQEQEVNMFGEEVMTKLGAKNSTIEHALAIAAFFDPEQREAASKDPVASKLIKEYNGWAPALQTQTLTMAGKLLDTGYKLETMRSLNKIRESQAQAALATAEARKGDVAYKMAKLPGEMAKDAAETEYKQAQTAKTFYEGQQELLKLNALPREQAAALKKLMAETNESVTRESKLSQEIAKLEQDIERAPIESVQKQQTVAQDVVDGLQKQKKDVEEQITRLEAGLSDPVKTAIRQGLSRNTQLTPEQRKEYEGARDRIDALQRMLKDENSGIDARLNKAMNHVETLSNIWGTYTTQEKSTFVSKSLSGKLQELEAAGATSAAIIAGLQKKYGMDKAEATRAYTEALRLRQTTKDVK